MHWIQYTGVLIVAQHARFFLVFRSLLAQICTFTNTLARHCSLAITNISKRAEYSIIQHSIEPERKRFVHPTRKRNCVIISSLKSVLDVREYEPVANRIRDNLAETIFASETMEYECVKRDERPRNEWVRGAHKNITEKKCERNLFGLPSRTHSPSGALRSATVDESSRCRRSQN